MFSFLFKISTSRQSLPQFCLCGGARFCDSVLTPCGFEAIWHTRGCRLPSVLLCHLLFGLCSSTYTVILCGNLPLYILEKKVSSGGLLVLPSGMIEVSFISCGDAKASVTYPYPFAVVPLQHTNHMILFFYSNGADTLWKWLTEICSHTTFFVALSFCRVKVRCTFLYRNINTQTSAISKKAVHQWWVADDLEKKVTSPMSSSIKKKTLT